MSGTSNSSAPAGAAVAALGVDREILVEGIALGVERAIGNGVRAEVRAFLEEYFGVLDKSELAAHLGVSERTVEQLWSDQKIPKDTALGERMPRTWLPAVKEIMARSRIKAREGANLRPVKKAA